MVNILPSGKTCRSCWLSARSLRKIIEYVEHSLTLVKALSPVIGYDKASKITHNTLDKMWH